MRIVEEDRSEGEEMIWKENKEGWERMGGRGRTEEQKRRWEGIEENIGEEGKKRRGEKKSIV